MSESDSVLFNVDINNYSGPLDVLLDLAKAQKVDLEEISITKLADQFHEYITREKDLNLEIASEYLLMATWLAYLKSKLLLPGDPEEEFKVQEVADKLKLQLKKLELIRLLSDQMLKRKRLGREIRTRGIKGNIRSIYSSEYNLTMFELLKAYSSIIMTKDFQRINIPKLPVFTTEDGIKTIKEFFKSHHTIFNNIEIVDRYAHTNYFKTGETWTNKWFTWEGTGNKTGVRFSNRTHFDLKWENGKIVEMQIFADTTGLNMELAAQ